MKKNIVLTSCYDNMQLDIAMEKLNNGEEVFMLVCDKSAGFCVGNMGGSNQICQLCSHFFRNKIGKILKLGYPIHAVYMSELMTDDILLKANNFKMSFSNVDDLKDIKYNGIDVGYAAFSSYSSYTRNIYPTFNKYFEDYINSLMQCSVRITEACMAMIERVKPDCVIVHNGRHVNLKPLYQLAKINNIDYIVTERQWTKEGEDLKDYYYNDIPHSARGKYEKMTRLWGDGGQAKEELAKSFFYNRRNALYAGDKIYIKDQITGVLPDSFDKSKINIAIFNSSEDEFYSISKEYDESGIFRNQYDALTSIFEHFKDNTNVHFYLRIHPNLANVPWKSHTDLYKLSYRNLTIIPPKSNISSYTLMDECQKTLVFDSTMGLEATFWGKPVISLNLSYYTYMDITYTPQTRQELYDLITNENLPPKKQDNCLKAAYNFMGGGLEKLKYFPTVNKIRKILGKDVFISSAFTVLGSPTLYGILMKILNKLGDSKILGKYGLTDIKNKTA